MSVNIYSAILEHIKEVISKRPDKQRFYIYNDIDHMSYAEVLFRNEFIILFLLKGVDIRKRRDDWITVPLGDPDLFAKIDSCIDSCKLRDKK